MATEKVKPSNKTVPKKSRVEMNLRQLLNKCEMIAKQEPIEGNWRLKKYVESVFEMITELRTMGNGTDKVKVEILIDYVKRASFLKALIETSTLNTPTEKMKSEILLEYINRPSFLKAIIESITLKTPIKKLEAIQQISHGAATVCADASAQEIHQKTTAKYGGELRSELFGLDDSDEALRKRNIIKAPNFTSNSTSQEDIDSLLKYHQNMQEKVAENMVLLTKSLKEQSQIASTIIRNDTEALKKSSELTDKNLTSLKVESERLQEHSRSAWKCWLWIMLAVVMVIFINMVLFMKVMKKRKYESY